jgi:tRNA(fMet)-specific endonuclease VapC
MVLLDTDHMSLLQRGGPESGAIARRLRQVPPDDVATTIVSFEEQTKGWLARLARARTADRLRSDYAELKRLLRNYCDIAVVEFDAAAADVYTQLNQQRLRIGAMDLKIAAIALANNATVLTRNARDFQRVPGLRFEDRSA